VRFGLRFRSNDNHRTQRSNLRLVQADLQQVLHTRHAVLNDSAVNHRALGIRAACGRPVLVP